MKIHLAIRINDEFVSHIAALFLLQLLFSIIDLALVKFNFDLKCVKLGIYTGILIITHQIPICMIDFMAKQTKQIYIL